MKTVSIEYNASGLNSKRLILNAVIDIIESNDPSGIVLVSPECHLEDIKEYMKDGLVYDIDFEILKTITSKSEKQFLQAFIK